MVAILDANKERGFLRSELSCVNDRACSTCNSRDTCYVTPDVYGNPNSIHLAITHGDKEELLKTLRFRMNNKEGMGLHHQRAIRKDQEYNQDI